MGAQWIFLSFRGEAVSSPLLQSWTLLSSGTQRHDSGRLPVTPGEAVLDLCAAPGGKATELATKLAGQGILVANDISASRARALLRNLELFGASNIFVTNEIPEKMTRYFPEFFHKILLDAPCSGEGMFHREPRMMEYWKERGPEAYVPVQKKLILQGARMLRGGGMLLYSTCTFSRKEDEEVIEYLLPRKMKKSSPFS